MKKVEIYTDGACSGNPGAGGYAGTGRHTHIVIEHSALGDAAARAGGNTVRR